LEEEAMSKFQEQLGGFFHDLLKAAGITMVPVKATERIREVGERLAKTIEVQAEKKAIDVIKRLQKPVKEGFELMEQELNELRARVEKLENPDVEPPKLEKKLG
jgi:hypothetical protein